MGPRTSPSVESLPKTNRTTVLSIAKAARWSGLILQPDSSPVSEEQLRLEIKAIYAGLMIAEAKCVNLDAAQAKQPSVELDNSQWQESIALHTTYLSEHHNFLMATQHPSATPDLKALPTMYSMPARMWKYGIHDFLEVLRSRRPSSQEYMLSFIILAYQMMMLFYETVPVFSDTWIECLGDLARYRMSMEEEKEAHAQWGCVAASWYIKASDRHPQIGRLYHHLAILERISLRKFACYGKSLTCVVPFPNARDSLRTLCIPIAGVAQPACSLELLSEASFCKLHALIFLAAPELELAQASNTAMSFLQQRGAFSWRNCGVSLAMANISALLGNGSDTNSLRVALDFTIQRTNEQTMLLHSTTHHVVPPSKIRAGAPEAKSEENWRLLQVSKRMTLNALYTAMRCPSGIATFQDSLAFVGVMFCFIHILCLVERETQIDRELNISLRLHFAPDEIEWGLVAGYLNHLAQLRPVTDHLVQCAQQGIWLEKAEEGKPLPEDFSIRGLVWAYFAFCPGWFDSDDDEDLLRNVETSRTHEARADRPLYYGLRLAFETPYLSYDATSATFSAGSGMTTSSTAQALQPLRTHIADLQAQLVASNPNAQYSPPSAPASSASDSDYVHVKRPAKRVQTASSPKT
ncbi:hypothetical protein LTR91_024453 [Friedmanniomyces endolithicus]|uniref:DNA/RNA-binding domain-containing protein n=2 Tax=Friedmanniomyces endolithicus TaxID=329885 RepID=A0AAN6JXF5_9PEZI|nr:hypothetical protein LTR57_024821 [Friedmanniomyces endolithicus]KAK0952344.1 hypothetical protein LTR91_024453 [Friedmanniomyces endolithicus]